MQLFEQPHLDVKISIRIFDVRAFVRAARAQAIREGCPPDEAKQEYRATKLGNCAGMLFDPGISPPGCQILDTDTEKF